MQIIVASNVQWYQEIKYLITIKLSFILLFSTNLFILFLKSCNVVCWRYIIVSINVILY